MSSIRVSKVKSSASGAKDRKSKATMLLTKDENKYCKYGEKQILINASSTSDVGVIALGGKNKGKFDKLFTGYHRDQQKVSEGMKERESVMDIAAKTFPDLSKMPDGIITEKDSSGRDWDFDIRDGEIFDAWKTS